jgi:hypothetical protein
MIKIYVVVAVSVLLFAGQSWAVDGPSADVAQCGHVSACDELVGCDAVPTHSCCNTKPQHSHCSHCCQKSTGGFFSNLMELERRKNKWILENVFGLCR